MKKMVLFGLTLCLFAANSFAQTTASKKKNPHIQTKIRTSDSQSAAAMSSSDSHSAFSPSSTNNLRIDDPTINRFNLRASGANVPISRSGIAGMPKGTYGFANGHLLLRNTTATSSGTAYGSGAVGTGTSMQGVGTSEAMPGVNGKSPYAGPWLWGERRPVYYPAKGDSTARH